MVLAVSTNSSKLCVAFMFLPLITRNFTGTAYFRCKCW